MKCKYFLHFWSIAILLLTTDFALAQNRTITGRVTNSSDEPLSGVSVVSKEERKGTATNTSGTFSITLGPNSKTLVFSSIGYVSKEMPISGSTVNVVLDADSANLLTNVVIIGYGAVKKEVVTGAISTISAKDFQKGAITSFDQMIAGKAPGVSITSNGGKPGTGSVIRIRGLASLNGGNDPLIVVDGAPFGGYVNPNDIASVTVLKDAASAAIYGSRASSGVILITTKKGTSGAPRFNFNTSFSVGKIQKYVDVMNADQFRTYISDHFDSTDIKLLGNAKTDWQKEIFQTALTTNNNFSVAGTAGKLPYRVSVGYLNQDGILKTDNMQRATGSISLTPSLLNDRLKVEINANGSLTKNRNANQGAIGSAVAFDPTQSIHADNSTFGNYYQWLRPDGTPNPLAPLNPVALLNQKHDMSHFDRGFGNVKLDYNLPFVDGLHAIINAGADFGSSYGTTRIDSNARENYMITDNVVYKGLDNKYDSKFQNTFVEYTLNYNKRIESAKSDINAMATYGYYDELGTNNNYASFDYKGDTLPNSVPKFLKGRNQATLVSYIGRLIYTFDNKYTLSGSIRRDGSSRFSPETRWGWFPSVAFAWNLANESFLKSANSLSNFKFRASYGVTGNQSGISNYSYIPSYYLSSNVSEYQIGSIYYSMYTPAPFDAGLKWEQTASTNLGVDIGFMENRITASLDVYQKKTKDLLAQVNLPVGTNFTNQIVTNIGKMESKGIELNLGLVPVRNEKVEWYLNFNAAYNKIDITALTKYADSSFKGMNTGGINGATGQYIQINNVGLTPYSFFVFKQVYDNNGKPIEGAYVDLNGDGLINPIDDQYAYKAPYPNWVLGFTTGVNYGKWSFNTVLRANIGNYLYNNVASNNGVGVNTAINQYLANAQIDILTTGFMKKQLQSDYYIQNASFLKMDNIGIAFNAGKIFNSEKVNLTLSGNIQNVFTVTNYKGLDPEMSGGIDNNIYPNPRIYTLGLNLNF